MTEGKKTAAKPEMPAEGGALSFVTFNDAKGRVVLQLTPPGAHLILSPALARQLAREIAGHADAAEAGKK